MGDDAHGPQGRLSPVASPGAFDIGGIDEVIHGRIRLGIMAYLANADVADFNELKAALEATQGNLSVHLRKLEDAGYVAIEKSFLARKPLTRVRLTPSGRKAFAAYLEAMGRLLREAN
jgi:DNA-binding MarR family transcriptional regulator